MKTVVPIFTTSEGHKSIAEAAHHFLDEKNIPNEVIFREEKALDYYKVFYRNFPKLFSAYYKVERTGISDFFSRWYVSQEHRQFFHEYFLEHSPTVVLNTSFGFSPELLHAKKNTSFSFVNIVPNPRSFYRQDISSADYICVFDERTRLDAKKYASKKSQIIITGWFVRKQFEEKYTQAKVRQTLQLKNDQVTILIVTGSEGTQSVLDLIGSISVVPKVQIIVACGNNAQLKKRVEIIGKKSQSSILALSFTKAIHTYMQASDLVIGKAGPNMLFEAIATHTPFFATTHVGGLEAGNLEIINSYKIGIVEENQRRAAEKIKNILEDPDTLEEFIPKVKALAEYNQTKRNNLLQVFSNR